MKKIIKTIICIAVVLVVLFAGISISMDFFEEKLESKIFPLKDPISVINAEYQRTVACVDWIYDMGDRNKVVGFHDYVFVGEVKKVVGTGYTQVDFSDGLRMFS